MKTRGCRTVVLLLCLLFGAIAFWGLSHTRTAVPALENPVVQHAVKEVSTPVAVKYYPKEVKAELGLSIPVQKAAGQVVLASSVVPADDVETTVSTVLNLDTGEAVHYVLAADKPWLATENKGSIGLYYGLKGSVPTARIQYQQDLIRVKNVHLGVSASFDQMQTGQQETFIGVGARVTW